MAITYCESIPHEADVMKLYNSVGWNSYTDNPATLMAGLNGSRQVVCAYDDNHLIGLARTIGDGATICYLQDILVAPHYQKHGVGSELFNRVFAGFTGRQKVLITDDDPAQHAFYQKMGLTNTRDLNYPLHTFVKFS